MCLFKDIMLQPGNTPAISMKNFIVSSVLILTVMSLLLVVPAKSYGVDASDVSSFMDLESSVKELSRMVKEVHNSVVLIITFDDSGGPIGMGNGIFIDNKGRIITNKSILENVYSAVVISESNQYSKVTILNRDEDADIALLQVNAINEMPIEIDYQYKVKPGERVIVIGKLSNLRTTVSEGLITTVSSIGDISDFIEIETTRSLLSYKYSVDGPVINKEGKVVGIMVKDDSHVGDELFAKDYYGEKLHAVSVRSIKALVEGPYTVERLKPPGKRVWFKWFLRKIKNYTISSFVTLYDLGFPVIMLIIFVMIVFISLIKWVFSKCIKRISRK